MSDFIFTDFNPASPARPLMETKRVFDVRDPKWGHPEVREGWLNDAGAQGTFAYLPEYPVEEKRAANEGGDAMWEGMYAAGKLVHTCDIETHTAPGCPEEPEASVELLVYKPKTLLPSNNRVLMFIMGGGLIQTNPGFWSIDRLCDRFNCIAIVPKYRCSYDAGYPAALNDVHAAYLWMVEHADELAADPDNVVMTGASSGAHLSLSLAFRLRRYGITAKGVVACFPQTDDRSADNIYSGSWDSVAQHNSTIQWLGANANSNFVGPESYANRATVAECIGFPPCFIHTPELDPDRDNNREFYGKLLQARSYTEYHAWGGAVHESVPLWGPTMFGPLEVAGPYAMRFRDIVWGNIEDCFQYDLRRPWVEEDLKANGPWW